MNEFDAIVTGGGLAGSCAALNLARRGLRVALLEAGTFPRHKVCGEFLSPEARPVLRRLQIEDCLFQKGAREVDMARLVLRRDFLEVPLPAPALAISRWILDETLWRRAKEAGIQALEKTRVRNWQKNGTFSVQTSRGDFEAPGLIDACGRRGKTKVTTRFLGLKTHFRGAALESGLTELHIFSGGYCGLVRVEGDLTNVCLLTRYSIWKNSGAKTAEAFFQQVLAQCPLLRERLKSADLAHDWLATGNIQFDALHHQNADSTALLCGDAARFIHPFTGDGMAMALRSGELAGATLATRLHNGDAEVLFSGAWQHQFAARLNWASQLAPLFLQPGAARLALHITRVFPALAPFLVAKTRG